MISLTKILQELDDDAALRAASMTVGAGGTRKKSISFKNGTAQVAQGYKDKDGNQAWKSKNKNGILKYFYGDDAKQKAHEFSNNTDRQEKY